MSGHARLRRALAGLGALHSALWEIEDYKVRGEIIRRMAVAQSGCIMCGKDISDNPMSDVDSLFCIQHCIICEGTNSVLEEVYGLADPEVERKMSAEVADTLRQLADRLSK